MNIIPRIEIQPTSRCTLRCSGCDHGIGYRPDESHEASVFVPLMDRLATFALWRSLTIGGGEPFLMPDLAGFIRAVSRGVPVVLMTNGYWLTRKNWLEFAVPVYRLCSDVIVSRYPPYVDQIGTREWDRRLWILQMNTGIQPRAFHPYDPGQLQFAHHEYHHDAKPITSNCCLRECFQLLASGQLAKCPLGRWLDLIPDATPEFLEASKRSLYYDLQRGGEGFAEWAGSMAVEACHYCGLATNDFTMNKWEAKHA